MKDPIDLAYVAGFLDGEGTFFSNGKGKIGVSCSNTNKPVIEWLHDNFGGSFNKPRAPRKANHRPVYSWTVTNQKALNLIEKIIPYLREKADQALLLMAIQALVLAPKDGRKVTSEVWQERTRLDGILKEKKRVSW